MLTLPEYPWESLAPYRRTAQAHPGGICDLSIGTPVDPTPQLIQDALTAGADAHGYPTTHGTPALREAISGWFARRRSVPGLDPVSVEALPSVPDQDYDVAFVQEMIPHHQSGIVEFLEPQARAPHTQLRVAATAGITTQQAQVADFRTWLAGQE